MRARRPFSNNIKVWARWIKAAINCRLDIHRWATRPIAPGRHKLYCKDCGHEEPTSTL